MLLFLGYANYDNNFQIRTIWSPRTFVWKFYKKNKSYDRSRVYSKSVFENNSNKLPSYWSEHCPPIGPKTSPALHQAVIDQCFDLGDVLDRVGLF